MSKPKCGSIPHVNTLLLPTMKNPFKGEPADYNLRAATTYCLFDGTVDPAVEQVQYQLPDGGFDIELSTITAVVAPFVQLVDSGNYIYLSCANLQTFACDKLTEVTSITVTGSPSVVQIALPSLTTVTVKLDLAAITALDTLRLPLLTTCPLLNITGAALTVGTVNQILADLRGNGWGGPGQTVNLSGGTSAAPAGQGATDKAYLIGLGATVTTN